MDSTQELDAMRAVASALDAVPADARARIVAWAASRYAVGGAVAGTVTATRDQSDVATAHAAATALLGTHHRTFAEFFSAVGPQKESEKVLVAGYWVQKYRGVPTLDAGAVNRELKHLGHPVRNITAAFDDLQLHKPALAVQTSKGGPTRQARNRYAITAAGEKAVLEMFAARAERKE